jgi:hypothetical protein
MCGVCKRKHVSLPFVSFGYFPKFMKTLHPPFWMFLPLFTINMKASHFPIFCSISCLGSEAEKTNPAQKGQKLKPESKQERLNE